MRVAMAQITARSQPSANLAEVAELTAAAAGGGADLIVFPEAPMGRVGVPLVPDAEPVSGPGVPGGGGDDWRERPGDGGGAGRRWPRRVRRCSRHYLILN